MRDYNAILKFAFSGFSSYQTENQIHIIKSAGELLFYGYEDPFITMGNVMPLISTIPGYDKFGWFYKVFTPESFNALQTLKPVVTLFLEEWFCNIWRRI